jgi:hypothetical protein
MIFFAPAVQWSRMKQPALSLWVLLIAAALLSAGCSEHQWQDETHNPEFGNFGAVVGT